MRAFLAVAALTAISGCRQAPSPTVFLDPALAVLVPPGTTLLAGVRMQKIRASAFYEEYVKDAPRLIRFREAAGLQDQADVWEYLIAFDGTHWVALMRGRFSEMGMEPRSKKAGALRISHRGTSIIGDEQGAVAFLNPTTAIAGSFAAIKRVLDTRNESSGVPKTLQRLAAGISSANEAWLVSVGPAPEFLQVGQVSSLRIGLDVEARTYEMSNGSSNSSGPIPPELLKWALGK